MKISKWIFNKFYKIPKIKLCPVCKNNPEIIRVGDNKQFFTVKCVNCGKIVANCWEAGRTEKEAAEIWNKGIKNVI